MISNEQIPEAVGRELVGNEGERIGKIEQVYLDGTTSLPEWLYVKTGRLIGKRTFVPTATAHLVGDKVEVAIDKDLVRHAPEVETVAGGLLPFDQGSRLYDHYGHDTPPARDTVNDIGTVRPDADPDTH
ncbi:PRC-barrel domain-containing protein [Actinocorallia longicatena]|uniref:PRC-barrel domain-containing protein n=1 Tax=Actinocorallia longicatena TaxID=111803 RepID=A0ABP6QPZ3_9ACTN